MPRIFSTPGESTTPRIDQEKVRAFFEERARRITSLGPVRAVIYQDQDPDLAERRDAAEKRLLLPLLALDGEQRLLDIGCGTGRWVRNTASLCAAYHGLDLSPGLIAFAKAAHADLAHCTFSTGSVTSLSLGDLGHVKPFDRILSAGVFVYLNDDELEAALRSIAVVAASVCRVVVREPIGISRRLTLVDHFSTDLNQEYNAIYRTEAELLDAVNRCTNSHGFSVTASGDVFQDTGLANRVDTSQRWYVIERAP